jgi:hypothetical protein
VILLWTAVAPAAPLVQDGRPEGEFVLAADAPPAERFAVDDVCHWLEKITGARVPVLGRPSSRENVKVFVGVVHAGQFPEDLARLAGNDGFAVRRKGGGVYVFGSRPRGTLNGLYAFLERNTDLIFARPHEEFGTIFGETKNLELTQTDFIDTPVFLNRQFGPNWPVHRATGEWLLRNRDNLRDHRASYKGFLELDQTEQYHTNFAVPIARQEQAHPEYYGYNPITKTRRFVKHGEGTMCLSVPGLPAVWARGLAEDVAAHEKKVGRKVEIIQIGPGDNWFCCQCERCVAPLTLPDGSQLPCRDPDSIKDPLFRSTQIMMFVNEAMETWKTLRPDVAIHLLAYIHFAEPPRVPVHPDLSIYFAPYPTNNIHFPLLDPRQPEPWRGRFEKWLTVTDRLGFYEYFGSKPSPDAFYAAANLRALLRCPGHRDAVIYAEISNDRGTDGLSNGEFGWDVGLMNHWVMTRLFWDPTQDVDALYRYFIERTYREAAPRMLAYYALIKSGWFDPDNKTVSACHASIAHVYKGMIVDRGLEKECLRLLAEAEAAARHPHSRTLIRRMREQYVGFGKDLARLVAAHVPEIRGDAGDFDSLQWEKPLLNDDFRLTTRRGEAATPRQRTTLQAAHDGRTLYLRFRADDDAVGRQRALASDAAKERWPAGDHIEFWVQRGNDSYVFAFNANGARYDAKNLDRTWDSGWDLKVRKMAAGWEAVATLPLATFQLAPGQETGFRWYCSREISRQGDEATHVSYQGLPLYNRNFPIIVE